MRARLGHNLDVGSCVVKMSVISLSSECSDSCPTLKSSAHSDLADSGDHFRRNGRQIFTDKASKSPPRRPSLQDHGAIQASYNMQERKTRLGGVPKPWPRDRIARGCLTVRATPSNLVRGVETFCLIQDSQMTISLIQPGGVNVELARVATNDLIVTLFPGHFQMFRLATAGGVDIYCFAADQEKRNKWVAVFRRMNIVIQAATPAKSQSISLL